MPSSSVETVFAEAAHLWHLDSLYADLATAKQSKLTSTEQACLRGLLCGIDPVEIAAHLHRQPQGLRVDLSRGIYRYIEARTDRPIKNWREVAVVLEQGGYKRPLYPDREGSAQAPPDTLPSPTIYQNLPVRDFSRFIGRDRELQQLLETLSFDCPAHCVTIEGIGGTGKTTLALAVAYHCLHSLRSSPSPFQPVPTFDAIVFTSAKQQRLTPLGVLPRLNPDRGLRDVFRAIARTLQCPDVLLGDFEAQLETVQERLRRQQTLLIVDNLEAVEDQQRVLSFLYDLPSAVKVMITSRQQTPFISIRLEPLRESESIHLIQHQAQTKGLQLDQEAVQRIYQCTSGVPAAIVYAVGQLAAGYPLKEVPVRLTLSSGDYSRFYFESSVMPIRGTLAHQLLMVLSLFPRPATGEAIAHVAASQTWELAVEGLAQLQQLSLISQHQGRYDMLALTREYAIAELAAHPEFEQSARDRWVHWYLMIAQEHGNKDWKDWNEYSLLEQEWENLQEAIEWCIAQNRYRDVRLFWQRVNCYTHTQGYRGNRFSYWHTRLDWTDWLLQSAEQQQDWSTVLDVLFDQAWTLTLLGQTRHIEQADALFQRAWSLRHHKDLQFQTHLAIHIAVLRIQQEQFELATEWLHRASQLLEQGTADTVALQRSRIHLLYYQGEICYKTSHYEQSMALFQQVLEQAQAIHWQRAIFLAKDWLADIAIQQENFHDAQRLLTEGLQAAEANRDECRAAFCKRSIAHLEKARGNETIAACWAEEAQKGFEQLGMLSEAEETSVLLHSLRAS